MSASSVDRIDRHDLVTKGTLVELNTLRRNFSMTNGRERLDSPESIKNDGNISASYMWRAWKIKYESNGSLVTS